MAKLFSVKLANLENEMKDLKLNTTSASSVSKIQELESQQTALINRIDVLDAKLNQMVDELTEILNQHANAIKDLTKINH